MSIRLDVSANRKQRDWGVRVQVARVLWAACAPFFRFSPRPFWGWRRMMLRSFGAQIGQGVRIHPTARILMPWHLAVGDDAAIGDRAIVYALGRVTIGPRATVSQHAHLCAGTHDLRDAARPLIKAAIGIGADAWVCADAFVGPNVRIGDGAILGARAVAMRDLPAGQTGVGNPMQIKGAI